MTNKYKKQCLLALCFFAAGIFTNNAIAMDRRPTDLEYFQQKKYIDDLYDQMNFQEAYNVRLENNGGTSEEIENGYIISETFQNEIRQREAYLSQQYDNPRIRSWRSGSDGRFWLWRPEQN